MVTRASLGLLSSLRTRNSRTASVPADNTIWVVVVV